MGLIKKLYGKKVFLDTASLSENIEIFDINIEIAKESAKIRKV